jgi:hypothetical protein
MVSSLGLADDFELQIEQPLLLRSKQRLTRYIVPAVMGQQSFIAQMPSLG